jgi:hypothetical protein
MAVPFDPADPRHVTPDQRLDEVATIPATRAAAALASCDRRHIPGHGARRGPGADSHRIQPDSP